MKIQFFGWSDVLQKSFVPQGKQCECGRTFERPHCINCGSVNCYVLTREADIVNGEKTAIVKCKKCGERFNFATQLASCRAPKVRGLVHKEIFESKDSNESILPESGIERKRMLADLFAGVKKDG